MSEHLAWTGPRIDWDSLDRLDIPAYRPSVGSDVLGEYLRQSSKDWVPTSAVKKPLIVELCGTANAGKNTLLSVLADYFQDHGGVKVRVIDEAVRAIHVGHGLNADLVYRTVALTVAQLYEARLENPGAYDLILVNRGLFDRLAFIDAACQSGNISKRQAEIHSDYLLSYTHLEDVVGLLVIPPEDSLRREWSGGRAIVAELAADDGKLLYDQRMVNGDTLRLLNSAYQRVRSDCAGRFAEVHELYPEPGGTKDVARRLIELIRRRLSRSVRQARRQGPGPSDGQDQLTLFGETQA